MPTIDPITARCGRRDESPLRPLVLSTLSVLVAICAFLTPTHIEARDWPAPPWDTGESRGEDLRVALITFGPGDEIASWFGHSAVLVEDVRLRQQRVYNFGMFHFGPDLLPKFLMGRLEFWVGEASLVGTLRQYKIMNRDIRLQELALSPELRMKLASSLAHNVKPQNRYYLYHHYDDNCSTRIRDLIDEVIGGQLREQSAQPGRMTLREHTRRHSQHNPFIDYVLMLWMNKEIDRPISVWDEMFLPEEMERVIARATYVDETGERVPLVSRHSVYFEAEGRPPVPEAPSRIVLVSVAIGLGFGAAAFGLALLRARSNKRLPRVAFGLFNAVPGLLVGLPATLLLLMWAITEHTVTYGNENLLFANPFTLMALPLGVLAAFGYGRAATWLRYCWSILALTSVLGLILKPMPFFGQDNWMIIAMLLPINLAFAVGWWMVAAGDAARSGHEDSSRQEPADHERSTPRAPGRLRG